MANSCLPLQSSTSLKLNTTPIFDSHSSSSHSHFLSLSFSPLPPTPRYLSPRNFPWFLLCSIHLLLVRALNFYFDLCTRVLRASDKIRRSSPVKAVYSDGLGTPRTNARSSGVWSIRLGFIAAKSSGQILGLSFTWFEIESKFVEMIWRFHRRRIFLFMLKDKGRLLWWQRGSKV